MYEQRSSELSMSYFLHYSTKRLPSRGGYRTMASNPLTAVMVYFFTYAYSLKFLEK